MSTNWVGFAVALLLLIVPCEYQKAAASDPVVVMVSNTSDIVNGDTTSINALINNPGLDGISLREAIMASNNTSGPKVIRFLPALAGATISVSPNGNLILLTSGDLTIDGDIDGDGKPDITFDGSTGIAGPTGPAINIWSNNNTIKGLSFSQFQACVQIVVPDPNTITKQVTGNRIEGNICSTSKSGIGIKVGISGLMFPEFYQQVSGIRIQDTVITGNTITMSDPGSTCIAALAGEFGSKQGTISGLTIDGNKLDCHDEAILVLAADTASNYGGVPGPVAFSDDNTIENITISNNLVQNSLYFGIFVGVANFGNRRNQ